MNEVVEWLESPEGEAWSRKHHRPGWFGPRIFFSLKNDIEYEDWEASLDYHDLDDYIWEEIDLYGMTGLPGE